MTVKKILALFFAAALLPGALRAQQPAPAPSMPGQEVDEEGVGTLDNDAKIAIPAFAADDCKIEAGPHDVVKKTGDVVIEAGQQVEDAIAVEGLVTIKRGAKVFASRFNWVSFGSAGVKLASVSEF